MATTLDALRAASRPAAHRKAAGARVLLAGAAGALGAAVLEQLLAGRAFVQVSVLVSGSLNAALPGLTPVRWTPDGNAAGPIGNDAAGGPVDHGDRRPVGDTAVIVFDRPRHANGREQPFVRPEPAQLPALAAWLKARGVRRLLVVLPHAPALLPQALRKGLANLDEHAVAQLGFEHLLFVRSAQAPSRAAAAHPLQRVADWALSQLQLMVPARDQPVGAAQVARFAVQLVAQWAADPAAAVPGTRVVPPEIVWEAAQQPGTAELARFARDWLAATGNDGVHHRAVPLSPSSRPAAGRPPRRRRSP